MLVLTHLGETVLQLNVSTCVGRAHLGSVHADASFLSGEQFRLVLDARSGSWSIHPVAGAVNQTLLDGVRLVERMPLRDGSIIAIGNVDKGIIKLPLTVVLPHPAGAAEHSGASASEPAEPLPDVRPVEVAETAHPAPDRAADTLKTAKAWAKGLGAIAGAVLVGVLRGAGSSGRGTAVYRGRSNFGEIILTVDGVRVYEGRSTFGTPILTIDGDTVRRGNSTWGDVLVNLDGEQIREGRSSWGDVIATIDGPLVYEGRSTWGSAIAYVDGGRRMAAAAAAAYLLRY